MGDEQDRHHVIAGSAALPGPPDLPDPPDPPCPACPTCPARPTCLPGRARPTVDAETSRPLGIIAPDHPTMPLIMIAAIIADAIIVLSIVIWVSHSD